MNHTKIGGSAPSALKKYGQDLKIYLKKTVEQFFCHAHSNESCQQLNKFFKCWTKILNAECSMLIIKKKVEQDFLKKMSYRMKGRCSAVEATFFFSPVILQGCPLCQKHVYDAMSSS